MLHIQVFPCLRKSILHLVSQNRSGWYGWYDISEFLAAPQPFKTIETEKTSRMNDETLFCFACISWGLRPLPPAPLSYLRLPFAKLGASFLAAWGTILAPREHLGRPCEQQDEHERVQNRIFIDLRLILGPRFYSLLGSEAWNFFFFRAWFQVTCCTNL